MKKLNRRLALMLQACTSGKITICYGGSWRKEPNIFIACAEEKAKRLKAEAGGRITEDTKKYYPCPTGWAFTFSDDPQLFHDLLVELAIRVGIPSCRRAYNCLEDAMDRYFKRGPYEGAA